MEMTNGGWARPERSQGNDCQGNNLNEALFHSPDRHSPDKEENFISSYLGSLRSFAAKILLELRDFFLQWRGLHGSNPRRPNQFPIREISRFGIGMVKSSRQ
jgi:hypothetical protein